MHKAPGVFRLGLCGLLRSMGDTTSKRSGPAVAALCRVPDGHAAPNYFFSSSRCFSRASMISSTRRISARIRAASD